jgi:protein ImuB
MAVAQTTATVPGLLVMEAEPEADAAALLRLARWCHRTTPLASADAPDGLWLDITRCAHLWGGEAALLHALVDRLARDGLQARAAVADTPGAAHALARFGGDAVIVVQPGQHGAAIAPLPIACLRLAPELVATLRRLGFEQAGHLARIPRALLARRFGPLPGLRLDQVHGRVHEILQPLLPEHVLQRRVAFVEPLLTAEALAIAIAHLVEPLCIEMERAGLGARQLDLLFERVDSQVAAIRIGTARPSRDTRHLVRLLTERLDTVDPGLGIEAMRLVAPLVEPLQWEQQEEGGSRGIAPLVDRLINRLGAERLYRVSPVDSDVPERSVRHCDPLGEAIQPPDNQDANREQHLCVVDVPGTAEQPTLGWRKPWSSRRMPPKKRPVVPWPSRLHAPARLLDPPRRVDAIAALPDDPPVAFTWRRHRHRICRADGPERIHGEWWHKEEERQSVRDYFQVEDESGQRFWLFRKGNGLDPSTGDLSWYLHGLF